MFLLRSAFWLVLAFMIIRPETDVRDAATTLSGDAMAMGSEFIAEQINAIECVDIACHGGKAIAAAALAPVPQTGAPMHVVPVEGFVPLPRPRPDRLG